MTQAIIHIALRRSAFACILILASFGTGLAHFLSTQDYHIDVQQIDGRYGLESVVIRTIYQDKKGFIWISTPNGLARFNGNEFLYYRDPKLTGTINSSIDIIGDIDGRIVVAEKALYENGNTLPKIPKERYSIYLLDPGSGQILPFSSSIGKNFPSDNQRIQSFFCHEETLYVGLKDGQIYTYSNGKWKLFYSNPSKDPIRSILARSPGKPFWVLAGDTLNYISPEGKHLERQYIDLDDKFWNLVLDSRGSVWINSLSSERKVEIHYKAPGGPIQQYHPLYGNLAGFQSINFDKAGRGWFWMANKFIIFDPDGRKITEVPTQSPYNNPPNIYFDMKNTAWISQRQQFITVRISKNHFHRYLDDKSISIRQMVEVRPGVVWAGTYSGLFELSIHNPTIKKIAAPSSYMYGICKDGPDIWIGIHGNYLLKLDSSSLNLEKWPAVGLDKAEPGTLHLLTPFVDKKGNVWVGSNMGLFQLDTFRRQVYRNPRFNKDGLGKRQVNFQWENKEGIWTATNEGLYLLDPVKGVKASFPEFSQYYFSYIHEKPKGVFWMATRGSGLLKWERESGRISKFGPEEGIVNPNLHAIFEDDKGRFWMPSDRGLIYFDPDTYNIHIFHESDGLAHDEFNRQSYLKLSDGSFLFGGIAGINHFHSRDFEQFDRPPPPLHLTNYDVWDPAQRKFISKTHQLLEEKKIILKPRQLVFQIKFALLDYERLAENRYAYKIEGINKDWILIRENLLRFTGLPYGKFTLRIKGAAAKGGWSTSELHIPIEMKRPVYLTGWFIALCSLLLLLSILTAVRWRTYRLKRIKKYLEKEVATRTIQLEHDRQTIAQQNQELEALNQTKDHLMAVIGHELRGPMLSIQNIGDSISYLLQNGQGAQAATLGEHIKHHMFSIRMLLDNLLYWGLSQAGKQQVFREAVPLRPLLIESAELVEFWMDSKKLNLTISCPSELTLYTDRNTLRIVLLNLLTNAIKFTHEGGAITLEASQRPGQYCMIEVADSGTGMDPVRFSNIQSGNYSSTPGTKGEKGTGMGMPLCHKLLESLGGQLTLDSGPGKGSSFCILFPPTYLQPVSPTHSSSAPTNLFIT